MGKIEPPDLSRQPVLGSRDCRNSQEQDLANRSNPVNEYAPFHYGLSIFIITSADLTRILPLGCSFRAVT